MLLYTSRAMLSEAFIKSMSTKKKNRRHDDDVKKMSSAQLRREIMRLRRGMRKWRDLEENAR